MTRAEFVTKMAGIKLLALDVDGVLTDDSLFIGANGFEMKKFNMSDGLYMVLAMKSGLALAVVSGRVSGATESRMEDLGVKHVMQGFKDKIKMIAPLLEELGLEYDQIAFVGNELIDIGLCAKAGIGIAVADACTELIETADYVTTAKGGAGAVREVIAAYFEGSGIVPRELIK